VKRGIVLMAELTGSVAARIHEIQKQYDPRMAAELPPHVTLTGSSGMGPIPPETSVEALREALEPITSSTPPIAVRFEPPMRFMQSNVVVLPLDPHGPLRALHERIKLSGLPYEVPRFAFTPHCTLSFYPELPEKRVRELLRLRFDEPVLIDRVQCWRAVTLSRSECVLDLPLGVPGT
jgi:2'-5' RNA ligase